MRETISPTIQSSFEFQKVHKGKFWDYASIVQTVETIKVVEGRQSAMGFAFRTHPRTIVAIEVEEDIYEAYFSPSSSIELIGECVKDFLLNKNHSK